MRFHADILQLLLDFLLVSCKAAFFGLGRQHLEKFQCWIKRAACLINTSMKPEMINRGLSFVTFNWRNVPNLQESCIVEILDEFKKWKIAYFGEKIEVKIDGLAPCTCYSFRIKNENSDDWTYFKGATLDEGYWSMHIARAVKVGKMPLVRKIAHSKPLLLEVENKELKTPIVHAIEKNDLQMVSLLITLGANVNTVSHFKKKSPLMVAVSLGHLTIANLLIDKGANTKTTDIIGHNILHYAVDSNNLDNVRFALKFTPNLDSKDSNEWTPLMRAAILSCDENIINYLIENGASTITTDKNGFNFEKLRKLATSFST